METAALVLEYLKATTSTQIIAGVVAVTIALTFKNDIRNLMRRIAWIKFPGGSEFSTTQLERRSSTSADHDTDEQQPLEPEVELPHDLQLNPAEFEKVESLMKAERAKAALWEYRFLNLFLVPHTQAVLDWISGLDRGTSIGFFHTLWTPAIPNANERHAIIDVLQNHFLIEITGEFVEITPKGREYVGWRGPMPKMEA
jgi:hypothetical protein